MSSTLTAYFLCAGYGRRLQPLTNRIPKPAIPFLGRTALEINMRQAQVLSPDQWICNTHHLSEQMEKTALQLGMDALYEKDILGTGGCLWNAGSILEQTDRFLVHNGDLIHTLDLQDLMNRHIASGNIATLAGIFRPVHNTLSVRADGKLLGVHGFEGFASGGAEATRLTFAGIAIYEREFLAFLKPGCEDIKPYWTQALKAGHSIGVVNYSQVASWYDFGTPQGLWEAAKFYMEMQKQFHYRYTHPVREVRPYVSNEAGINDLPEALRNVLIYEESLKSITANTEHKIIGRDFWWDIKV